MKTLRNWITVVFLSVVGLAFGAIESHAEFVFDSFGTFGQGGAVNGQTLAFGTSGSVFELDAFINVVGQDLDGSRPGTSRQLSTGPPDGIFYTFSHSLSADRSDLLLTYRITNTSGGVLPDVQFLSFVDAEIDAATSFFDEFGTTAGILGLGPEDPDPDSWEIDEPGFVLGDIFANLLTGTLDNTNSVPSSSPEDVSLALGFRLGDLKPLDVGVIEILLSDDGSSIGSFALVHSDPTSPDTLTLSGQAMVSTIPEPRSLVLLGVGILGLLGYGLRARRVAGVSSRDPGP